MPHIRFARFVILDSIPGGQWQPALQLCHALEPLVKTLAVPVSVDRIEIPTRRSFEDALHNIMTDAIRTDRIPLLHIECPHGNDDGMQLGNGEFVYWDEFCEQLTRLNVTTRLNLFVSIAACLGAYLASRFIPTERAPVAACLSVTKKAYPDQLYRGFFTFYRTLLTTLDGNAALRELNQVNVAEDLSFYLAEATDYFKLAYRGYLAKYCTPERYRQRALEMHEEQKERGLPVSSVEDLYQILVSTAHSSFEKAREHYFMVDLFPEHAQRFPVSAADVAPSIAAPEEPSHAR
jgi:hypothetical protein